MQIEKGPCFYLIIPVFNAEKFIDDMVNSVKQQKYGNFAVIFVNDGSLDSSEKICKSYCEENPEKFFLISSENRGPLSARELGIRFAMTKMKPEDYIWFVDADDLIEENALEELVSFEKEYHPDIMVFNYKKYDTPITCDDNPVSGYTEGNRKLFLVTLLSYGYGSLWRYVFSARNFPIPSLENYYDVRYCEDKLQSAFLMKNCRNALFIPKALYSYRQNETSLTNEKEYIKWVWSLTVWDKIWEIINENKIVGEYEKDLYLKIYRNDLVYQIINIFDSDLSHKEKLKMVSSLKNYEMAKESFLIGDLEKPLSYLNSDKLFKIFLWAKKYIIFRDTKAFIKKIFPKLSQTLKSTMTKNDLTRHDIIRKIYSEI